MPDPFNHETNLADGKQAANDTTGTKTAAAASKRKKKPKKTPPNDTTGTNTAAASKQKKTPKKNTAAASKKKKQKEKPKKLPIAEKYEELWQAKYELLKQYKEEHGNCSVPQDYLTDGGVKLGSWVCKNRIECRKFLEGKPSSMMTQQRLDLLKSIGFDFKRKVIPWNSSYELLRQYREQFGNCKVPRSYVTPCGVRLKTWVDSQRQAHLIGALSQERVDALKALGVNWNHKKAVAVSRGGGGVGTTATAAGAKDEASAAGGQASSNNAPPMVLAAAKNHDPLDRHKNIDDDTPGDALGGSTTAGQVSPSTVALSDSKEEAPWDCNFRKLVEYKKQNGHARVPRKEGALGNWVNLMRVEGNKLKAGKPADITQSRVDKLDAVGFDWNPFLNQWNVKLDLLEQYRADNGDCRVPKNYVVDGVLLGEWVGYLRKEYKKHQKGTYARITQERIDALNAVGFDWDGRAKTTASAHFLWNYEQLREYKEQNGNCERSAKL